MASLNHATLIGYLGKDPELRFTASGVPVANFSVAVNNNYTNKDGDKVEEVDFINIVVWKKLAENCEKYLKKGRPVAIEGRIKTRSWDAEDGTKRYATDVVASNVQFLGSGEKSESAETPKQPEQPVDEIDLGDDIPF